VSVEYLYACLDAGKLLETSCFKVSNWNPLFPISTYPSFDKADFQSYVLEKHSPQVSSKVLARLEPLFEAAPSEILTYVKHPAISQIIEKKEQNDLELLLTFLKNEPGKLPKLYYGQFILYLLRLNYYIIDTFLLTCDCIGFLTGFFSEPKANVFHSIVSTMIKIVFQNHHVTLQNYLLDEKNPQNILSIIISNFDNPFLQPIMIELIRLINHVGVQNGILAKKLKMTQNLRVSVRKNNQK